MANSTTLSQRVFDYVRFTLRPGHRPPALRRLVVATAVALVGSLVADAVLVAVGTSVFPSTRGYEHFAFFDYAALTVIGVLVACAGWPVVARFTEAPRRLFFRLAIATTLVLFLPDLWLLAKGGPVKAVGVLMVMHVAVAVATYQALIRIAPIRSLRGRRGVIDARSVTASR